MATDGAEEAPPGSIAAHVHLSNKACPHYYCIPSQSEAQAWAARRCGCPKGRCWYREQKARRKRGLPALDTEHWLDAEAEGV